MPEFTKQDYIRWIKKSLAQLRPIMEVIGTEYEDQAKRYRAVLRLSAWLAEGCPDE